MRHMLGRRGPGRIVNISSIIGSRGYTRDCGLFSIEGGSGRPMRALVGRATRNYRTPLRPRLSKPRCRRVWDSVNACRS
jgi:hypothetical protein